MIARFIRSKTKRTARRLVASRANSFRHSSEPQTAPVFGLPDSYQAWLADAASKEIGEFYRA